MHVHGVTGAILLEFIKNHYNGIGLMKEIVIRQGRPLMGVYNGVLLARPAYWNYTL